MKFLEAHQIVAEMRGGDPTTLFLGMSGTGDPLSLYLRAAGAERGLDLTPRFAPFGTLHQTIHAEGSAPPDESVRRYILMPWDFLPDLDWRSGFPPSVPPAEQWRAEADHVLALLGPSRLSHAFFLAAPVPPVHSHPRETQSLVHYLSSALLEAGTTVWPSHRFSLSSYLASGSPLVSSELGSIAREIVAGIEKRGAEPKKVLVTDLDGVLWRGVIGEDGPEGVECAPEGRGYPHFVYQTYLRKLQGEGVLVAAVSRNDPELVDAAFRDAGLTLRREDFVAIIASYGAKSAQIRQLAESLNLGFDAFVFVDDNPVELAEVGSALPEVACIRFPESIDEFGPFLDGLAGRFARRRLTAEDRERTELYRRRLETMTPSDLAGSDLTSFLMGLDMRLRIHDRSHGNRERAVQLINKTNQFNVNGIRRTDEEVQAVLEAGGHLYSASLSDRSGDHGEILSCLIDVDGRIRSWVLSCRVFQRRVEHRFLAWLNGHIEELGPIEFQSTARNQPVKDFLSAAGVPVPDDGGWIGLSRDSISESGRVAEGLFHLEEVP